MEEKTNMQIEPVHINLAEHHVKQMQGFTSVGNPDLKILIKNEILHVHKTILASRNEVFKVMLDTPMIESEENQWTITDCDPEAFKVFLGHLYTGQMLPESITLDLLIIADKYIDLPLKQRCIDKLKDEVSMDNILEVAEAGTNYDFGELITACQKFIVKNYTNLIGTSQLRTILENKTLVIELFKGFDSIVKHYDELLVSSKKHKIFLGGVDILLVNCENCGMAKFNPVYEYCCKTGYMRSEYITSPITPSLTFFAEDIEWLVQVTNDEDEIIGIELMTTNKNVRTDIQMTILSDDPDVPNINVEKKNKSYGLKFFKLIPRDKLQKRKRAYVRRGGYFAVEITFQSTCVEVDAPSPNSPANS